MALCNSTTSGPSKAFAHSSKGTEILKVNIVVSANITTFKFRIWCRKNIKNFIEIYLETSKKILARRDYKNLYKLVSQKKIKNVVGIDMPFNKPKGSNLYLKNNKSKKNF